MPGDYLGTPHTWGPLIHGDPSYMGTPHTWGPLLPGDLSYLGTPHTWGPVLPWDPSYLGTPYTWGLLMPGDPYSLVSNGRHALNKHNTGPFSTILINITYLIRVTVALKSNF